MSRMSRAYSEVDTILNLVGDKYLDKIPKDIREFFIKQKDKNFIPNINIDEPFENQKLERETIVILSILNYQYWCESQEEKNTILQNWVENEKIRNDKENSNREYNKENIFIKNNEIKTQQNLTFNNNVVQINKENEVDNQLMVSKDDNMFKKFFAKIKKIINKYSK